MKEDIQLHRHSTIRIVHKNMEAVGKLEYSPAKGVFEVVLPGSGVFGYQQDIRMPLNKQLIDRIELLPDGNIRLEY